MPQFFNIRLEPIKEINSYLRYVSRRLAQKSLQTISEHLKEFLVWVTVSNLSLEDMTEDIFDAYIDSLCAYRKPSGERLSWNTVNARCAGAYRYLIWCYEQKYCPNLNPSQIINTKRSARNKYRTKKHPSRKLKEPVKFLNLDVAIRFIEAVAEISGSVKHGVKKRNKLIASLMLQTGLRISEVTSFPLKDLPEINTQGHSTPARIIGKGSKARLILIPNKLLLKLWEYADIDRERICDKFKTADDNNLHDERLFLNENGREISKNWIEKLFSKASTLINIKTVPHALRHTYGTYHYLLNKDLPALANLMGHASETTTQSYYIHTAMLISYAGSFNKLQDEIDRLIEVNL